MEIGAPADRLTRAFGRPAQIERVQAISILRYSDRGVVAHVASGKIAGLWALAPDK